MFYRGPDVKRGIVSHLVNELHSSNVSLFVDYELRPGSRAWPQIQACLLEARVQVVIISRDFQGSWWCMEVGNPQNLSSPPVCLSPPMFA